VCAYKVHMTCSCQVCPSHARAAEQGACRRGLVNAESINGSHNLYACCRVNMHKHTPQGSAQQWPTCSGLIGSSLAEVARARRHSACTIQSERRKDSPRRVEITQRIKDKTADICTIQSQRCKSKIHRGGLHYFLMLHLMLFICFV
jgi:hypothetical protein